MQSLIYITATHTIQQHLLLVNGKRDKTKEIMLTSDNGSVKLFGRVGIMCHITSLKTY